MYYKHKQMKKQQKKNWLFNYKHSQLLERNNEPTHTHTKGNFVLVPHFYYYYYFLILRLASLEWTVFRVTSKPKTKTFMLNEASCCFLKLTDAFDSCTAKKIPEYHIRKWEWQKKRENQQKRFQFTCWICSWNNK